MTTLRKLRKQIKPVIAADDDVTVAPVRFRPATSPKRIKGVSVCLVLDSGVLAGRDLTPAQKLILGLLRSRQDDRQFVQITERQIAAELGLAKDTVQRGLQKLKAAGLVDSRWPGLDSVGGYLYSVT